MKTQMLFGMKIVPTEWFAAMWTNDNGYPSAVLATGPDVKEVLVVIEKQRAQEGGDKLCLFQNRGGLLKRIFFADEQTRFPIAELTTK